jgi:predicted O-methyltransferase YrrM
MTNQTLNLSQNLYDYILSVSLREPPVLKKLREETSQLPGSIMQISPEQGQFMALLIELIQAKKTIDIGVYTGYSSLIVALALPENGKVIACDIDEKSTAVAKRYWEEAGVSHKIDLCLAPALETLDALIGQGKENSFDFIFIDADKKSYDAYYERSLTLIRTGGLIMIDNTLQKGAVADSQYTDAVTQSIRDLNLKLSRDERISLSLLPVSDGITLARKK